MTKKAKSGTPFKMKGFSFNPYAKATPKTPKLGDAVMGGTTEEENGDNGSPFKFNPYTKTRVKYNPKLNPVNISNGTDIPGEDEFGKDKTPNVKPPVNVEAPEIEDEGNGEGNGEDNGQEDVMCGFMMKGSPFKQNDEVTTIPKITEDVRVNPDGGDISAYKGTLTDPTSVYTGDDFADPDAWKALVDKCHGKPVGTQDVVVIINSKVVDLQKSTHLLVRRDLLQVLQARQEHRVRQKYLLKKLIKLISTRIAVNWLNLRFPREMKKVI